MNRDSILAAMVGLGVGAGLALLFAPESGHHLRGRLAHRARGQARRLKHQAEELQETAANLVEQGREQALKQRDGIVNAVEAGKRAYLKTV
ncbi:YtxH domain-containing protein [Paludibaculum fermentans]|uniref:YtxH domain-containing protein n=1 Tax=Paludibaculum fermentans TaxID=1473598 RepID=A0A7S7SMN5_PALFE|nr:YtxH domain-containing protein [Paludibaculum fermentans]QOY89676.1 YtxH domain-containing protein [Paludibaculum fermentans]